MTTLLDIASQTIDRYDMLPEGSIVVALVSGGADSTALLRLLASGVLGDDIKLSVLHVNHQLRGQAADEDAAFVESLSAELGVPCTVVSFDVAAYALAEGLNLEDAGRRVRYRFADDEIAARCRRCGVSPLRGRIAVAHTLDDQMETFLMRLVTGSGPSGLRAMSPVRDRIVRPLIGVRRAGIVEYLHELGQQWREDATNADTTHLRSWVRHELKPLIEQVNPRFDAALERTLQVVSEEDTLLAEMADAFAHDFSERDEGRLVFEQALMSTLTAPMARRAVRSALFGAFPEASRLEFEHVEAVAQGMSAESFARDLPFGLHAETEYGKLIVSRKGELSATLAPRLLEVQGTCDLDGGGSVTVRIVDHDAVTDDPNCAYLDAAAAPGPFTVDSVREGDHMRPLGMSGTKKLSDLLCDDKVPKRVRGLRPVVRYRDQVVWLAGVRMSEDFKVTASTGRVVELCWRCE